MERALKSATKTQFQPADRLPSRPPAKLKRWLITCIHDYLRPPSEFAPFPNAIPDPDGQVNQWLENMTVVPLSAKEYRCKDGWFVGPRVANNAFWYWFENGGGWYSVGADGPRRTFRPGDLLLFPPGLRHAVKLHQGNGIRHLSIHFHAHVYGGIDLLTLLGFPQHLPALPGAPYADASIALAREFAIQAPGWKRAYTERVYTVLLHILRQHGDRFRPIEQQLHQKLPRLLPALEWIERHLGDPELTVSDLAQKTGVSEVYLRTLFHQVAKVSPTAFIQRRRIECACALLRLTTKSIKTISKETGFNELSFFYHVFSRRTGLTPAKYRVSDYNSDSKP